MRLLILGGGGMLGHKLVQRLQGRFEVWTTVRAAARTYRRYGFYDPARTIDGVDADRFDAIVQAVGRARPDAIINAIGVIKQLQAAHDPLISLTINSLLPHRLAALGSAAGARVVHVSTDCVFSGRKGRYTEDDTADAEDLYGRSKLLGEIGGGGGLTLRTSIVGRELTGTSGLIEWFLSRRGGRVHGYTGAIYSGLTTAAFADILANILLHHPDLSGVFHLASEPIAKYDLLRLVDEGFGTNIAIEPMAEPRLDRSLDGSRLRAATGLTVPSWSAMVAEMAADPTPYDLWRSTNA